MYTNGRDVQDSSKTPLMVIHVDIQSVPLKLYLQTAFKDSEHELTSSGRASEELGSCTDKLKSPAAAKFLRLMPKKTQ